ncbi:4-(cytidine 5'-diphospho)-2-C-methyl-D-erythritol kinase [Sphingomonas sp. CROZ-RG-20F-R02-07]|uniref:4-(cytidine 5'-diphospho)-2-C-methyl-D-erythritol kinase n=1 Tax=Sphingomonas sp. CROZ-RG-20F-R02-07 TaxID=2914832 RepID=UPI001F57CCFA|nr:4-(cytidine 5'-diphospho)-2-C-methyl-D-erythritol kinase [Sphingomonas sp. CROZ-RG-20F-R02-07]
MTTETAPAKINLALHIRHRRADGYHELETLFAFCRDGDEVRVEPAAANRFAITGPFAQGLAGEGDWADNLVTRAADAFAATFGIAGNHAITLDKRLPIASGIGGGSADAAATLRALARLHGVASDDPRLVAVAGALGADVPACLLGRTAFGTGKGEALAELEGLAGVPVLLVNPGVGVSTAAVFARWDGIDRGAIADGPVIARAVAGRNDLEPPALALAPVIAKVRARLGAMPGVRLARMSGSGATCFALFDTVEDRGEAARALAGQGWWMLESTLA